MVKPVRHHTRFEKARIIGARALQISMGAPLYVTEDELREKFSDELVQLYGVDEAKERVVLDPMKMRRHPGGPARHPKRMAFIPLLEGM